MKPGHIIVAALAQADGQTKPRPVLVLREARPFGDFLVCGISTQLRHFVPELDEFVRQSDEDFAGSGLVEDSLIRIGFLATISKAAVRGYVGQIGSARLQRLLSRLSQALRPQPAEIRRIVGIIPARFASTRFPGKPLALIAGKPLIQRVVEQCQKAKSLSEVIVATDDERIASAAKKFCRVEMTRADHPSGSDRVAEVAGRVACDAVVNIQGDEPLIDPAVVDVVAQALADCEMSTAATPIKNPAEYENPNVVKVVVNAAGRALYFSRRTIPYLREAASPVKYASLPPATSKNQIFHGASRPVPEQLAAFPFLKHLGIYGYRRETLLRLVSFPVSPLENAEKLEQLRALDHGIQIAVVKVDYNSVGVDAPEDVEWVERYLKKL